MAPEVIRGGGNLAKATLNPRKADVYSFAIICFEILTGENPSSWVANKFREFKEQVKFRDWRPELPDHCPKRLAALIRRCWHPDPHKRPLFPEICQELRYIKGLLLRDDQQALKREEDPLLESVGSVQLQKPWGGDGGGKFSDIGTSIKRIKLAYSQSPGYLTSMEVVYELDKIQLVKTYAKQYQENIVKMVVFEEFKFITRISGYVSHTNLPIEGQDGLFPFKCVASITIYTNIETYGPFGNEEGEPFTNGIGRVIGFHGRFGAILDSLGVWMILRE